MAVKHNKAHEVEKGDPKIDGPYLDDIREVQEMAYRERKVGKPGKGQKALDKERAVALVQMEHDDNSLATDKGEIAKKVQ